MGFRVVESRGETVWKKDTVGWGEGENEKVWEYFGVIEPVKDTESVVKEETLGEDEGD